jgi:hypothetical protein
MTKRFWQFVHDRLEDAWHWVYYHKLVDTKELRASEPIFYSVRYVNGQGYTTVADYTENVQGEK